MSGLVAERFAPTRLSAASPLVAAILGHAESRPDAVALQCGDETLSYSELATLAHELAASLPDDDVLAVLAHKTARTVAFALGALAARRSVLLLAPTMPEDRSAAVVAAADIRILVDPRPGGPVAVRPHAVPRHSGRRHGDGSAAPRLLLTTSGTTGVPKVVSIPLDAVERFGAWARSEFSLSSASTVLNLAPLNFDLTLLEVWATLASGGRAVLVPPERAVRGGHVLDLIEQGAVDLVQAVPTFYRLMLESATAHGRTLPSVSTLVFTGDRVDADLLGGLRILFPAARMLNVYGMTETNDSFAHEVGAQEGTGALPIGMELPGVAVRVRAEDGTLSDHGTGELLVSTPFQAEGYLDRTASAERFVTLDGGDGRVFVRTGDLVDRRPGEPTRLLGRLDRRVKIRGLAVDLAEIERILETHPLVGAAVAVAEPDPIAGHRLAAVVQRAFPSDLDLLELRSFAAMRLASGSAPSEFHVTDAPFPLTITGKTDRSRALSQARGHLERDDHEQH
ncbi:MULTISPECIES: AMP-binding protein [unclassified Rathayibacter]|uniref:AMP-binding protein n=1 Tax=unclassified Rathayibacter TaxID=2609250 RepID=UPI00188B291C|nr:MULTISPECIES: AMP-binding protein [unclassified Rathayibacter]MBF4463172.1 AMP-binding protein [Rathayibacter sp. VKM Ac-2879]MBF4504591.1 AMP-binding protein [Rathayibacter sp. VKM Ac-2878]